MTDEEAQRAWLDLTRSNLALTARARGYLAAGLPVGEVLNALGVNARTWRTRLDDLRAWEETNG
jgi:hypothetical protein